VPYFLYELYKLSISCIFDILNYMQKVSATYAKQNFAAILDQAQREPVRIQRHDREIAVLISAEEFERFRQQRVRELMRLVEENGRFAESQGMTEEVLEKLLAEE